MEMHNPSHPGHILKEALEAIPMSVTNFAAHIRMSRNAVSRVVNQQAAVTPEMSIKLAEAFGQPSLDHWYRMQNQYDFWRAKQKKRKKVSPLISTAA